MGSGDQPVVETKNLTKKYGDGRGIACRARDRAAICR